MVDPRHKRLSITRQCRSVSIARIYPYRLRNLEITRPTLQKWVALVGKVVAAVGGGSAYSPLATPSRSSTRFSRSRSVAFSRSLVSSRLLSCSM